MAKSLSHLGDAQGTQVPKLRRGAEVTLRDAVAMQRKLLGNENLDLAQSLAILANTLNRDGKSAEGETMSREALAIRRRLLGNEHPEVASSLQSLANILRAEGKVTEAEEFYRETLDLRRKLLGDEHPTVAQSLAQLALVLKQEGKLGELASLYRKLADQGNAEAQDRLAVMYASGSGMAKDPVEAVKWYRKAAEHGVSGAQLNLGMCYEYGTGVASDPIEAAKWYREAATQGRVGGQICLGWCFVNGFGVVKDVAEAAKWYRKAADQGDQSMTAWMYTQDIGVPNEMAALKELATWQTWLGQDAAYETTRRRLVQEAEGTDDVSKAEQAAKIFCLRPSTDDALQSKALNLAHRAVELGKNSDWLPWDQLALGLAEYRNGKYAAAEQILTIAEHAANDAPKARQIAGGFG